MALRSNDHFTVAGDLTGWVIYEVEGAHSSFCRDGIEANTTYDEIVSEIRGRVAFGEKFSGQLTHVSGICLALDNSIL